MMHLDKNFDNVAIKQAARNLKLKLEQYKNHIINPLIQLATIMDPRIKTSTLKSSEQQNMRDLLRNRLSMESFRSIMLLNSWSEFFHVL